MTSTTRPEAASEFHDDLATLSGTKLREKYRGEANCHANMKRRAQKGLCEVDPAWAEFRGFLADMGPRPTTDGSIDRIDNANRRYGPGLCRWATKAEQTRNRANTKWITFSGNRITVGEFAETLGVAYSTIHAALQRGDAPEVVAARAQARRVGAGAYMPTSADTPAKREAFNQNYSLWSKAVKRTDRRKEVSREAYAVVGAAVLFRNTRASLESAGINEVAPGEEAAFEARFAREFGVQRNALDWAQEAARKLMKVNPGFAVKLYPTDGRDLIRLAAYWDWFLAPND
ncbi:hypothetical protein [Sphingomonas aerolata]|uniref:hypothetical protein n=1 Tax=Sphingomonas aerolata TaxID=185951 RepID=UPI00335DBD2A